MNHKEYENYVETVVRALTVCRNATIHRNRKFTGVRQPGHYEIDIACEIKLDDALHLLIIVECKNWKRPVDREEVQKLIQTRDAISAQKAAFASASGFTKEAVEVAKANGVAVWVVGEGVFDIAAGGGLAANIIGRVITGNLVDYIYQEINYTGRYFNNLLARQPILIPFNWLYENTNLLYRPILVNGEGRIGRWDPVVSPLIEQIFQSLQSHSLLARNISQRLSLYMSILIAAGMKPIMAQKYMAEIKKLAVSREDFFGSFKELEDFDGHLNHKSLKVLAPIDWLEQNGWDYFISTSPNVADFVRIENNVVWANVIWLLNSKGIL